MRSWCPETPTSRCPVSALPPRYCAACPLVGKLSSTDSCSRRPGQSNVADVTAPVRVPLARLMAMGLRSLVDALHERLERRGIEVKPAYAFVLLASREAPLTS